MNAHFYTMLRQEYVEVISTPPELAYVIEYDEDMAPKMNMKKRQWRRPLLCIGEDRRPKQKEHYNCSKNEF